MRKERFLILLIALFIFLVVRSFLVHFGFSVNFIKLLELILFFSCLIAISDKKRHLYIALFLFGASVTARAVALFWGDNGFYLSVKSFELIFSALFYAYSCLLILAFVIRDGKVTRDRLAAAICVYLLIGVTWGMFFALQETTVPGSLSIGLDAPGADVDQEAIYFSFVTLTTLGYGDIAPISAPARILAIIEAIIGQIYLAVMIARLVGLHIADSAKESRSVEKPE